MSETREYPVEIERGEMGFWAIRAPECPANVLRKQLGEPPWSCRSGLTTNMQGAVPVHKCSHLVGELGDRAGPPVVTCAFCGDREAAKGANDSVPPNETGHPEGCKCANCAADGWAPEDNLP